MASPAINQSYLMDKSDVTYVEPIGKGAFGTVFRVALKTDEGITRDAAAKKVASSTQSEEELKFMSTLRHENIITFYGYIRDKTELTIITELAEKGDLQSFLHSTSEPLPKELVKKWTREAAEGIRYLHQQKTVHKDVKSSNYLITTHDVLKLCDFGTVGDLDHTGKTEHRKGTVRWMAPEVIKHEVRSSKSDVFAYGIVTWEICTREVPFAKLQTTHEIMEAITDGERPRIPRKCPVVLRKIMERCWIEPHEERPSMDDVLAILESDQDNDEEEEKEENTSDSDEDSDENNDRYKFFEKVIEGMQDMTRREHERQHKNDEMMNISMEAHGKFRATQTSKAETRKQSVEKVKQEPVIEDRMKILKEKHTQMVAEKAHVRDEMVRVKSTISGGDQEFNMEKMLGAAEQTSNNEAKRHVEQMFQACYKSEDWDEDDLTSFTRMSTMHANIPDVIGDFMGETKNYAEPQDASDIFQLKSIPSIDVLVKWKEEVCSNKKVGFEYCYIEAGKERFDKTSIEQLLVVHRALEIKQQVKNDLSWMMIPPFFPTLVEKRAAEIGKFRDLVLHEKCDDIIEDYGMSPMMLSQYCCDHALSYHHILWFLTRLNQMQSDVFCLYPQSEDDTQSRLCALLEDEKETPSSLILIFNVRRSEGEVLLAGDEHPGSHFSLCYVNSLTNTVLYADSLGWPAPAELCGVVEFYYQCIYGRPYPSLHVTFCHEPSSLSADGIHACCEHCATYYPLQTCGNVSGLVVIILASVACLDRNLFLFLTSVQRYSSHPVMSHFQNPTKFSKYLRFVLGIWLGEKDIDLIYLTPKNFSKYQLVNSFDPSDISDFDLSLFHPLIVPTPGLIELLLPEITELQQAPIKDTDTESSEGRSKKKTTNLVGADFDHDINEDTIAGTIAGLLLPETDELQQDSIKDAITESNKGSVKRKTTDHWVGADLDQINEDTIACCSRMDAIRLQFPGIPSQLLKGRIVKHDDDQPVTDVFQQSELPNQQTLQVWQSMLEDDLNCVPNGDTAYIEVGDTRYDKVAIHNALKVDHLRSTKLDVEEEIEWFEGYQMKPLAEVKIPGGNSIKKFRNLIHGHKPDEVLASYNMNAQEMSLICCNRQISAKHVQWIVDKLNAMQSKVVCTFGADTKGSSATEMTANTKSSLTSVMMICQVHQSDGMTHFSDRDQSGSHFTLCYVDVESKKIIYGDSYGWPAPEDLQGKVKEQFTHIFNSTLPQMEITMCHDTSFNTEAGQHQCSPLCGTYYPLQSCDAVSGVACSILAVVACMAPEYFEFLTVPQYNKMFTGSFAFHLQYPTLHSNYLRRVLTTWFADEHIDIDNVVTEGFDKYKQLAVSGSMSTSGVLGMGSVFGQR